MQIIPKVSANTFLNNKSDIKHSFYNTSEYC